MVQYGISELLPKSGYANRHCDIAKFIFLEVWDIAKFMF